MNFNRLHYFYVTAREGSMTRAAARLDVTTPTVSEQVRRLEQDLGVVLFHRLGGGIELPKRGRELYERATAMFRIGEAVFNRDADDDALVTVRAGICAGVGAVVGAAFFEPLFATPSVRCLVDHLTPAELDRRVATGELNLAITTEVPTAGDERGLEYRLLRRVPLSLVGPPGASWPPRDGAIDFIAYRRTSRLHTLCDAWLHEEGVSARIAGEIDDPSIMLHASAGRELWCVVPTPHLRESAGREHARLPFHAEIYGVVRDSEVAEHVARLLEGLMGEGLLDDPARS